MTDESASTLDWKTETFTKVLKDMNRAGEFRASFLVDSQGLPVAAATTEYDADSASVMASQVKNAIEQLQTQINLAQTDEVTVRGSDGLRLVSRYFKLGGEALIMVVIAPPDRPYRQVTSRAIRAFQATWNSGIAAPPRKP